MLRIFAVLVFAVAFCGVSKAKYSQPQQDALDTKGDSCLQELNLPLSVDYQQRAQSGDVSTEDPMYKKYVACFMRQLDVVDDKGKVKPQKLFNFLAEGHNRKLLKEAIDTCDGTVEGETPDDLAFNFHVCFWTKKQFSM